MTGPLIEIRDVSHQFRVRSGPLVAAKRIVAADGISLQVQSGGVLGIVGESGCGKSTLAKIVLGLIEPTAGDVLIDGRRLSSLDRRERARLVQPVFQDPYSSLNPRRRIRDIVALPLVAQGRTDNTQLRREVDTILERVGLDPAMGDRLPAQLSGGQRQRVAIARALLPRPRIVVCDEPTSALDVSVQAQILNLLAELRRDFGLTYLFISHNLAVVEHIASEVAVMYLGRIVEQNATQALFHAPRHPYTQALLASVLTPEPGLGIPEVGLGDAMPDPSNIPEGCRFHPRCPLAQAVCRTPPAADRAAGGMVECHFANGVTSTSPARTAAVHPQTA
jgi:peptide/nickel transport system ATP-binding protein